MKNKLKYGFIFTILCTILTIITSIPANAQTSKEEIKKIEITYDYIPKNGSDDHNLMWGSSMGIYAKVILSDGTVADGDSGEINWEIKEKSGKTIQSVHTEYTTSQGYQGLEIYAPYGYTEELIIKAVSKNNTGISSSYQINTISTSAIFGDKLKVGKTFFRFNSNEPDGKKVAGKEPLFTEEWDKENTSYSVTLPENTYQIEGYEFKGWKDENGKLYQPEETLIIELTGSEAFYELNAAWKKTSYTEIVTTQPVTTENQTISEKPTENTSTASSVESNKTGSQTTQAPKTGDTGSRFIICFIMIICGMIVLGRTSLGKEFKI